MSVSLIKKHKMYHPFQLFKSTKRYYFVALSLFAIFSFQFYLQVAKKFDQSFKIVVSERAADIKTEEEYQKLNFDVSLFHL